MSKFLSTGIINIKSFAILSRFQIMGIIFILSLPGVSFCQQTEKLATIEGQLIRSIPSLKDLKSDLISPQTSLSKRKEIPSLSNSSSKLIDHGTKAKDDSIVQRSSSAAKVSSQEANTLASIPSSIDKNFDGQGFTTVSPASPSIAAGPNHVIQMINNVNGSFFKIWDRDGNVVINQTILSSLFGGGGYSGEFDPVAIYDQFADRYMMTELGTVGGSILVNTLVIAISQTNDPTGGWNLYKFTDNSFYHSYPHFAAWPNALYASTTDFFYNGSIFNYLGTSLYAIDKNQMVAGNPTVPLIRYRFVATSSTEYKSISACPVNISGTTPPAAGSPGMFMYFSDDNFTSSSSDVDSVGFISLQPDFATPANSVISFFQQIAVAPFKSTLCVASNCIPGPGGLTYESVSDRFMRHIYYRNFGTHESIVANHTVDANHPDLPKKAGVRWYEFRRTGGEWTTYQQSTYSPDEQNRWMGSIGINSKGQIALSYSITSPTKFGSFYFTGRNVGDPLNQMSIADNVIVNGTGYGTIAARWGAYNDMVTDVVNDSLFWTTAMYGYTFNNWKTRIAAIKIGDLPAVTPLTVTINKASGQADPTFVVPIHFTVVFDRDVTGFDASDISFTGSTTSGTLVATVTGSGSTYDVSVSGMTTYGDVVASVVAGAATANDGQVNLASTSTDHTVFLNESSYTLGILKVGPDVINAGSDITYTIYFTGPVYEPENPSTEVAYGITVTDVLPAGTTFKSIVDPDPSFTYTTPVVGQTGTVTIYIPALYTTTPPSITLVLHVNDNQTTDITNTISFTGPPGDGYLVDNTATKVTQIAVPPTISCPGDITLYTNPGFCYATISSTGENAVIITGNPAPVISYSALDASGYGSSGSGNSSLPPIYLSPGIIFVTITATNIAGTASCSFTVTVIDNQPPIIVCPENKVVNAEPGKCTSASVPFTIIVTEGCRMDVHATSGTNGVGWLDINGAANMPLIGGLGFPVGINTVSVIATDASGNTSTCSFNVTVLDIEKPLITAKPSDVTVECTSQIPVANLASVIATDNCGTPTITHVGDAITNQTCSNKYTLTRTYQATDGSGNTATVSQLITVDDKTPPTITGLTPSKRILAPPNHKMVDVTLAYTVNDNCVSTPNVTVSITSNEPVNGTGDGDTDIDWEVIDSHHIRLRAERAAQGTGRIYTITIAISDGCNAPVSATTEVMVVHNITGPHSGNSFKVGSTVAFTGEFWDVPGNKHTAKWSIDGASVSGIVTEPAGAKNGKVTGSYKFTTPGVYKLQMNVTDQKGVTTYANTNGDLEAIVVIYDPNGGYTYGGGYYNSPAGALVSNPSSIGKASYGFAMNYFKNSTNPKGETQFEFKVGDFEFNALNFDYLVISNSLAQFKGTGKIIGGQSGVGFTMTVTDGQLDGTGVDKIRMKIYNKNNGKVIYDNQPGVSDAALPTQAVGSNSIVVISGTNSPITLAEKSEQTEMKLKVEEVSNALDMIAFPNPSAGNFTINIKGSSKTEKITMQVVDMYGRIIETRNVNANSTIRFGDQYRPGAYFVKIIQGKEHKELKLVKLSD